MNRWEQSIRYEALLNKEIAGADADGGKEKGERERLRKWTRWVVLNTALELTVFWFFSFLL